MIILFAIFMVCIFITLWIILACAADGDVSVREFITGKKLNKYEYDRISDLEKKVKNIENTLFIVGDK